jgi:hypothetical protein
MNDRIRQLAEQAGIGYGNLSIGHGDNWQFAGRPEELERFAQLIIKECGQLILDRKMGDLGDNPGVKEWEEGYNEAVHDCYYLIRKHFGVAE